MNNTDSNMQDAERFKTSSKRPQRGSDRASETRREDQPSRSTDNRTEELDQSSPSESRGTARQGQRQMSSGRDTDESRSSFSLSEAFSGQIEDLIRENLEGYMRNFSADNFSEVRDTVSRYARRYPTATIAAGAVIGLAAGLIFVRSLPNLNERRVS